MRGGMGVEIAGNRAPFGVRARKFLRTELEMIMVAKILHLQTASDDPNKRNPARLAALYMPSYSSTPITCPPGSSREYTKHFKRLTQELDGLGLNSETFSTYACMAVEKMVQVDALKAAIKKHGATYTATVTRTGEKTIRPRPEVAMLAKTERTLRALLIDLGLKPRGHAAIGIRRRNNPRGSQSTGGWGDM